MKRTLLVAAVLLVAASAPASASEQIQGYFTDLTVNTDSTLSVVETIDYDFGGESRHGIYRDIAKVSPNGPTLVITDVRASADGGSVGVSLENSKAVLRIRLGDPERTIIGRHRYVIAYTAHNAIRYFSDSDELYWNAIPHEFDVPINRAQAKLSMPDTGGAQLREPDCYLGLSGTSSREPCTRSSAAGGSIMFDAARPLSAGEGMSISSTLPAGFITRIAPKEETLPGLDPVAFVVLGGIGFVFVIIALAIGFSKMYALGLPRRRSDGGDIVVQYDPPEHLSAARCGYLSKKGDIFTAAILQLAVNGWLQLEFVKKKGWFGASLDITFSRRKQGYPDDLFERQILDVVTPGEQPLALSDIKRRVKVGELSITTILSSLGGILEREGVLERAGPFGLFKRVTERGRGIVEHIAGLRIYLHAAEKERLAFHNAPEKSPETFEALLPYAVALGVDKPWREQFADVYRQPDWARGDFDGTSAGFGMALSQLGSDLRSSVNAYSSGSGGGGSSGGGSGGGGGGSW